MADRVVCGLAALAAASACLGCGQGGSAPLAQPEAFPLRITADWLRRQPGLTRGDFSFHLLDAGGQPLADWQGLELSTSGTPDATEFRLTAPRTAADDLYLYVTYAGRNWALDYAALDAGRSGEYALLSVPHRIEDVLVVGLTRLGPRTTPAAAGPLCSLRFARGRERLYRSLSQVNEDPGSAPMLSAVQNGTDARLSWTERNLGDYNNNSQVEIADITPLGLHFGETSATAEDPLALLLVDGDENGEINLADLVPIGRNFGRYIQGYSVYHSTATTPDPGSFSALSQPTVERSDIVVIATPEQLKHRLDFTFDAPAQAGPNHYYVRAWSGDDGDSEGPQSNTASLDVIPGNLPPVWDSLPVITSATGRTKSIALTFADADDPEGTAVSYVLRYIDASLGGINSPQAQVDELAEAGLGNVPPYTYTLSGLTPGATYHILIQARDADGQQTSNAEATDARVPAVGLSDAPWAGWRGGGYNTGTSPSATVKEPLTEVWTTPAPYRDTPGQSYAMVVSDQGWLGVEAGQNQIMRIDTTDGSIIDISDETPASAYALGLSLSEEQLYAPTTGGLLHWDPSAGTSVDFVPEGGTLSGLALGDYFFLQDNDRLGVRLKAGGPFEFQLGANFFAAAPVLSPPIATDGTVLYSGTDKLFSADLPGGASASETATTWNPKGLLLDPVTGDLNFVDGMGVLHSHDQTWQLDSDQSGIWPPSLPCLIRHASPPLLVFMEDQKPGLPVLTAVNADTGQLAWTCPEAKYEVYANPIITASQDRIFVKFRIDLYVVDFNGRLRERINNIELMNFGTGSDPVPMGDSLFVLTDMGVKCFRTDTAADGPPVWQGTSAKPGGGIRALVDPLDGTLDVQWDYAVDDHGLPVYYSLYYSADSPPEFSAPFTHTKVVTDIPDGGLLAHSYSIGPLDMDKRWYVGVRASDRPWDESPNLDPNTNWLAQTPGWQEERLLVGAELPPGEIYFMRGLLDPHGAMHLLYNDRATAALTHVQGNTGAWTVESANIGTYAFSAFDPVWNGPQDSFAIGVASSSLVGTLDRTGADTWSYADISSAQPVANPMVALAYPAAGGEAALSYTRQTNASFPPPERYEMVQTSGGLWQAPGALDAANNSGRDIGMLLNPLDSGDPWTLMQRGFEYAPNHLTPSRGELTFAQSDGAGGWTVSGVDSGGNAPDSDCGKRCRLLRDGPDAAPRLHAAYLDLNADPDNPIGELRYARYAAGGWSTEPVAQFDLSFQTASLQFTYGEIGLALLDGEPVSAMLQRSTMTANATDPHLARLWLWRRRTGGGWIATPLTDSLWQFPRDREPCVLLADGTVLHLFYATLSDEANPKADTIVHLWRDTASP